METDDLNTPGLYLDVDHPAVCSGSITAWHFCHYAPWLFSSATYSALFQVWRETTSGNYTKVFEVPQEGDIPRRQRQFLCVDITLAESEYVSVTQGDVLGVYMPGTRGLRMIAMDQTGNRLHHSPAVLDVSQLTQITLDSTQEMIDHALHLTADIGTCATNCFQYLIHQCMELDTHGFTV